MRVPTLLLGALLLAATASTQAVTLGQLRSQTHFHGIAADPADANAVFLATHHGFYRVSAGGQAVLLSVNRDDFMGFTPHPTDPSTLYASGHPSGGGNLGFIVSNDGGRTWRQLSSGAGGPVDFHQMDVSKADPRTIYGVYKGLQQSRDGGKTWQVIGPAPEGLIDLAASAIDVQRLYAATKQGLLLSTDGGKTWQAAHMRRTPVTLVHTEQGGRIYAFLYGVGFISATEPALGWTTLASDFGERYLLHLATVPKDGQRIYAINNEGEVLASTDGGRAWRIFGDR